MSKGDLSIAGIITTVVVAGKKDIIAIGQGLGALARLAKTALPILFSIDSVKRSPNRKRNKFFLLLNKNTMNRMSELKPGLKRTYRQKIRGERMRHVLNFNPNKAGLGEEIS